MGKMILFLVIGSFALFGIIQLNLSTSITDASENVFDYSAEAGARNIAHSMAGILKSRISDSTSYRVTSPATDTLLGGTATYTVVDDYIDPDSLLKVTVAANYTGISKTITAYYQFTGYEPPEFLQYAACGGTYLKLHDSNRFLDYNDPSQNTSIHVNGNIYIHNSQIIEGFVTYTGTDDFGGNSIVPNSNPESLPSSYQTAETVDLPNFDADNFIGIADEVYPGDLKIENDNTLGGTEANPKIIYVGAKLTLEEVTDGDGTDFGYAVFVVKGVVDVKNVNMDPTKTMMAIYNEDKFQMGNGATLCANVYSLGELTVHDHNTIYGSFASQFQIKEIHDGNDIYYIPARESLTQQFFGGTSGGSSGNERSPIVKYWHE